MNRGTVKVEEAFGKDRNRDDATAQNWPHQQSALLDVINHVGFSSALSQLWQANNRMRLCSPVSANDEPLASLICKEKLSPSSLVRFWRGRRTAPSRALTAY